MILNLALKANGDSVDDVKGNLWRILSLTFSNEMT